jgi:hypothetical protein
MDQNCTEVRGQEMGKLCDGREELDVTDVKSRRFVILKAWSRNSYLEFRHPLVLHNRDIPRYILFRWTLS